MTRTGTKGSRQIIKVGPHQGPQIPLLRRVKTTNSKPTNLESEILLIDVAHVEGLDERGHPDPATINSAIPISSVPPGSEEEPMSL